MIAPTPNTPPQQSSLFAEESASMVFYEQPLNERIRALLRLEHLFGLVSENIASTEEWHSRAALTGMIEITDLLARFDLRVELIKELERHTNILQTLQNNPQVDGRRLQQTLNQINEISVTLRSSACQPAQLLRKDELIYAIKQRLPIPGGTCNFDLPAFHYWLTRSAEVRVQHLHYWLNDLRIISDGTLLALGLIRNSAQAQAAIATAGFYQQPAETNVTCQMVRVAVAGDLPVFPEISGGKHRFTIRFQEQPNSANRPAQTDRDIPFDLYCCNL